MTLYCYRDNLDQNNYSYFGVNLYFVWDTESIPARRIKGKIKEERRMQTGQAISKVIDGDNPVVQFTRACIAAGIKKTPCYFKAKTAGVSIRKQVFLALYEFLLVADEETEDGGEPKNINTTEELAPIGQFEEVRDLFAEELSSYMGMDYSRTDISECNGMEWAEPDTLAHGDFLFEIGELQEATFRYWGHYHHDTGRFKPLVLFEDFDILQLRRLLKEIA